MPAACNLTLPRQQNTLTENQMRKSEIEANARKPYADTISKAHKQIGAVVDQLAYVYPDATDALKALIIRDAIFKLRTAFDAA